jgi:hypothetical protein
MRPVLLIALAALLASGVARAESPPFAVAQNDSFVTGTPRFQGDFQAGDIIAARLTAPPGFGAVLDVGVSFGGDLNGQPVPVTIKIWDDTAETLEPGPELFQAEMTVFPDSQVQTVSLVGVGVPERFRVGLFLHQSTPPVVGQDTDGTIDADRNLVRRAPFGWQRSQASGATGDWIIRARLAGGGGTGSGGGSGGSGDPAFCFGQRCPTGQFCDDQSRSCTFECVTKDDCGGAFCNRFGQCVGENAGCCQTGARPAYESVLLALGVLGLLLVLRRPRR